MPGRDGTGPLGAGPMTGKGLGVCTGTNAVRYGVGMAMGLGLGFACRRGFGRGFGRGIAINQNSCASQKEILQGQKDLLQNQLEVINEQLKNL